MTELNKTEFAQRLIQLRKDKRMSQVELARAAGLSQANISSYETTLAEPSASAIAKLATALGVSTDILLGLKPVKSPIPELDSDSRILWKRFKRIRELSQRDQRAFIHLLHSFARTKSLLKKQSQHP